VSKSSTSSSRFDLGKIFQQLFGVFVLADDFVLGRHPYLRYKEHLLTQTQIQFTALNNVTEYMKTIGKGLTYLSLASDIKDAIAGDDEAKLKSVAGTFKLVLEWLTADFPGVGMAGLGVSFLEYALNKFMSTAQAQYEEYWWTAYSRYLENRYPSFARDWIPLAEQEGGQQALERRLNEFWDKPEDNAILYYGKASWQTPPDLAARTLKDKFAALYYRDRLHATLKAYFERKAAERAREAVNHVLAEAGKLANLIKDLDALKQLIDWATKEMEKEAGTVASINVTPASSQLTVGQDASFQAMALFADNHKASWSGGAGSSFKADKVGTFSITATYQGISGNGTITVTEPACPDENAHWDNEAKNCVCNEGFEWNEKLGKCIDLKSAIDDVGKGKKGEDLCDENAIRGQWQRLQQLAARSDAIFSGFESRYQKFLKEINDQNSTPCQNNLIAVAFAGGSRDLESYGTLVDEVKTTANDLIERVGVCPDLKFQLDYSQLVSLLSQVGRHSGQMKQAIADMEAQLGRFGCDKQEIKERGDQVANNTNDPNVIGDGGPEICGDNQDNDGDGLYDEDCAGQSGSNVIFYLVDCGTAKDDVFGLSVTGQGNLGTTPVGGANYFSRSLPPGNYVATVTVISAPDNIGTFCITISEGDKVIASQSGGPAQGTQIQVPFTVGQTGTSSALSLPLMNFDNIFPEGEMPMQREGADRNRESERMETRGKNPFPTKRQKPAEKRPN
jgi:hypothetical protein